MAEQQEKRVIGRNILDEISEPAKTAATSLVGKKFEADAALDYLASMYEELGDDKLGLGLVCNLLLTRCVTLDKVVYRARERRDDEQIAPFLTFLKKLLLNETDDPVEVKGLSGREYVAAVEVALAWFGHENNDEELVAKFAHPERRIGGDILKKFEFQSPPVPE